MLSPAMGTVFLCRGRCRMARRILLVSLRSDPVQPVERAGASGQAVLVQDTARALQAQGFGVDVLTTRMRDDDPGASTLGHMGRVMRLPRLGDAEDAFVGTERAGALTAEGLAWIRGQGGRQYQLVHSYYWLSGLVAGPIARWLRVPWVHTPFVLPGHDGADPVPADIVARQLIEADRVLVSNSEMADRVIALSPEARVRVVPPAVDPTMFFPRDPGPHLRQLGLTRRGVLLPVSAAAGEQADAVIRAWRGREQAGRLPAGAHLLVIGGGGAGTSVGREGTVVTLPGVPHRRLAPYYAAACCTIALGRPYSLGLTALESLASGVPVVAPAEPGLAQILWDPETGVLVPPGDGAALVEAALDLYQDPRRAARWGKRGLDVVHACFTVEHMARELVRIYSEVEARLLVPAGL